jgi:hypothetical protein
MVRAGFGAMATGVTTIGFFFFLLSPTEGTAFEGIGEIIVGTKVVCPANVRKARPFNPLITDEFSSKSGFLTVNKDDGMFDGFTIVVAPKLSGIKSFSWFSLLLSDPVDSQ